MPKISSREKRVILLGSIALILAAVVQFIYFPMADRRQALESALAGETDALHQLEALREQYRSLTAATAAEAGRLQSRPPGFSLFSFLDTQAEQSRVKSSIDYMKPSSQAVEGKPLILSRVKLKLTALHLKQCIDFLTRVDRSGQGVRITSLSLAKEGKSKDRLTLVLEAQTLVAKEGA